ncbi:MULTISPECIES: ATP-binding cassette domain-containing protein [unclassified Pseudactinotalea]|uniref:ATP-binding cassette domain-containing protein n=1 Tax=unclassified Pseudactinotalea TaxID=2649176 RepID=UPI0018836E9B|nr:MULTISPECIES: ATP-binding cassette domain-containing protein [unclassified Pseudactinotalea]
MSSALVRLRQVTKSFGSRQVLTGLDLEIRPAHSVALLGPSGAGKSTLLSIIAGLLAPDGGSIERAPGVETVWIVQNAPMLNRRSALENIMVGALSLGAAEGVARSKAREAMQRLGLSDLARTRGHRLSGGERQRVAVARGLLAGANLLLVDEPTASLDADSRELVLRAIHGAVAASCAAVVATHDDEVARSCDEQIRLRDGRVT